MIVSYRAASIRVPDFLIVGAARSGTTAVFSYLAQHPQVFMPQAKEPMFLSVFGQGWSYVDIRTGKRAKFVVEKLDDYLKLFRPAKNGQMIGEASAWYLYHYQPCIRNIQDVYGENAPGLKIIILLRNPADRAWSHYWLRRRNGEESLPFELAIQPGVVRQRLEQRYVSGFDYIGFGKYFHQVKAYQENFPQVRILLFEDLVKNMARAGQDLCEFLGIDDMPFDMKEKRINAAGTPKNRFFAILERFVYRPNAPKSFLKVLLPYGTRANLKYQLAGRIFNREQMDSQLKKELLKTYREDILELAQLIRRDLSHWLSSTVEMK
jgi:hypothetical protein